jgi:hypothetical protein
MTIALTLGSVSKPVDRAEASELKVKNMDLQDFRNLQDGCGSVFRSEKSGKQHAVLITTGIAAGLPIHFGNPKHEYQGFSQVKRIPKRMQWILFILFILCLNVNGFSFSCLAISGDSMVVDFQRSACRCNHSQAFSAAARLCGSRIRSWISVR